MTRGAWGCVIGFRNMHGDTIMVARRIKTEKRPIGCDVDSEVMEMKVEDARQKTRIDEQRGESTQRKKG